jgi:hypothetical protein
LSYEFCWVYEATMEYRSNNTELHTVMRWYQGATTEPGFWAASYLQDGEEVFWCRCFDRSAVTNGEHVWQFWDGGETRRGWKPDHNCGFQTVELDS